MNISHRGRLVLAGLLVGAAGLTAQAAHSDVWNAWAWDETAWIELGGAWVPDLDSRLDWRTSAGAFSDALKLKTDLGFAVHGGFHQDVRPWLAFEVQGGFLYNGVDEVTSLASGARLTDASLMQVPIMMNAVFQWPLPHGITPYAGAGAGAMLSWLDVDAQLPGGEGTSVTVKDSSTEVTFAYQAFAGIRFEVSQEAMVSVNYRYLDSGSPGWDLEDSETGHDIGVLEVDRLRAHTLTIGFHVRF
jgi:opacity protein-like surface antigen